MAKRPGTLDQLLSDNITAAITDADQYYEFMLTHELHIQWLAKAINVYIFSNLYNSYRWSEQGRTKSIDFVDQFNVIQDWDKG